MPLIGLGTWQMRGRQAYDAIRYALDVGYRHIDTATGYGNEAEVGRAIRDSGVARDEIFVTTKLPPENAGRARQTITASLRALDTEFVDLWLIHWPPGGQSSPPTWRDLLAAQEDGLAHAVGVSNYSPTQIDELVTATGRAPEANQIRWSPQLFDAKLLDHSRANGVVLEGYSPFRAGNLDVAVLAEIAEKYAVTPSQVVLRWHVEHEVVAIPKSVTPERITSNFDVFGFSLEPNEVAQIDALSTV